MYHYGYYHQYVLTVTTFFVLSVCSDFRRYHMDLHLSHNLAGDPTPAKDCHCAATMPICVRDAATQQRRTSASSGVAFYNVNEPDEKPPSHVEVLRTPDRNESIVLHDFSLLLGCSATLADRHHAPPGMVVVTGRPGNGALFPGRYLWHKSSHDASVEVMKLAFFLRIESVA